MLGSDFPSILCIKTAVLKMFSLYTFKILLDLNNSLVCSNLLLLKSKYIPIFFEIFEILFLMYFICVFQLGFSSNKTPRNFIDSVQAISRLFIFSFGKISGISSLLPALWKNDYLVFFTLSESLLEINHSLIFL